MGPVPRQNVHRPFETHASSPNIPNRISAMNCEEDWAWLVIRQAQNAPPSTLQARHNLARAYQIVNNGTAQLQQNDQLLEQKSKKNPDNIDFALQARMNERAKQDAVQLQQNNKSLEQKSKKNPDNMDFALQVRKNERAKQDAEQYARNLASQSKPNAPGK